MLPSGGANLQGIIFTIKYLQKNNITVLFILQSKGILIYLPLSIKGYLPLPRVLFYHGQVVLLFLPLSIKVIIFLQTKVFLPSQALYGLLFFTIQLLSFYNASHFFF